MVRVLATGTFEILHPGHLTYLRCAKKLGDELIVIVARDKMIKHKREPAIPEQQRLEIVQSLSIVDRAILGSERDIFEPLYEIKPDIIALGYDQCFDVDELLSQLHKRGLEAKVVRIKESHPGKLCSCSNIVEQITKSIRKDKESH
ncbi:MAG: FAD synthase [Methanocellales archaeon]|nr:FAD synthase [Methanocellales archaeon]